MNRFSSRSIKIVLLLMLPSSSGCTVASGAIPAPGPSCTTERSPSAPRRPGMTFDYLSIPPEMDGDPGEQAWDALPWLSLEHPFGRLKKTTDMCRLKAGWNYRGVFLAFHTDDADISAPRVERDGPVWAGDCLELFLDPEGRGTSYFEIAVNPFGDFYDYFIIPRKGREPFRITSWNGEGIVVKTRRSDTGCDAEIFIPFRDIASAGISPSSLPDHPWLGHIGVTDRDGKTFSATNIFPVSGAHHPASFGRLSFAPQPPVLSQTVAPVPPPGASPVDLSSARVYSPLQGEFGRGKGFPSSPRGYGMVRPIVDFIEDRKGKGAEYPDTAPLPGAFVIHPADFEDARTQVDIHYDPTLVEFKASGRITVFFRRSPAAPENKGDGTGVVLRSDRRILLDRWVSGHEWRAASLDLGPEERLVSLEVNSGPETPDWDFTEVAVYREPAPAR